MVYQKIHNILKILWLTLAVFVLHLLIQIPAASSLSNLGANTFAVNFIRILLIMTAIPIVKLCFKVISWYSQKTVMFERIKSLTLAKEDLKFIICMGMIDVSATICYSLANTTHSQLDYVWGNPILFVLTILSLGFIQPFLEELLYRGILLNGLENYSTVLALSISSLFFSYVHVYDVSQLVNFHLIGGIIYSFTFLKTQKLCSSVMLHSIHNLLIICLALLHIV